MPNNTIVVAALYKFADLPDYSEMHAAVLEFCSRHELYGTLLLAEEGINGTVAGGRVEIDALMCFLKSDQRLADLEWKESYTDKIPFIRMKVKLKKEIVTLGIPGINPNKTVGTYVAPEDWNALIADPEVLVIDTRNNYECDIGTFQGALDPQTATFREFPEYVRQNINPAKHKKIAMFCTGGIRCEKASAYMLEQGFEQVYHLQGGILKYLEKVPVEDSLWQGECFVFDQRVTVAHGLQAGDYVLCHGCRQPVAPEETKSDKYVEGISCPGCFDLQSDDKRARLAERQRQSLLARERGEKHIGAKPKKNAG